MTGCDADFMKLLQVYNGKARFYVGCIEYCSYVL
jgi:hypothetical protein